MERQRSLFDSEFEADMEIKRHARRTDPATSHQAAADVVRSGRMVSQCDRILSRLRGNWVSSIELAAIAPKYTSRISDLRAKGIEIDSERTEDGIWHYRLRGT